MGRELSQDATENAKPIHNSVSTADYCKKNIHLFESIMQEAHNQILILHDLDPHVVKTVVEYMYGSDIMIEWDDVVDYLDIGGS